MEDLLTGRPFWVAVSAALLLVFASYVKGSKS